jgi:flagellar hook protein FlgE
MSLAKTASRRERAWRRHALGVEGLVMGIFGALNTAVTGLRAQSFALENISGNIANSQTTGFKRVDTMFQDLIPDATTRMQLAGSVLASSRSTNSVQGDLQSASIGTFMAVNGDGFFMVQKAGGFSGTGPAFDGIDLFTRRGDFVPDRYGYLVNGAGYYLMGVPIDAVSGNPIGNVPQVLQFQNDFLPASRTTEVQYRANLASIPRTTAYDPTIPGSELLDPTGFTVNPLIAGTGTVIGSDVTAFTERTLGGGGLTVFDDLGNPINMQVRWAKVDSATSTQAGAYTATNPFAATTLTDAADTIAFSIAVDGGAPTAVLIDQAAVQAVGNGDTTIDSVAELASILTNAGVTGVTVSSVGGQLTITSNTSGPTSSVAISGYTLTDADANSPDGTGLGLGTSVAGTQGTDRWEMFYQVNSTATGTDVAWRNAGVSYTFDAQGRMDPPVLSTSLTGVVIDGVTIGDVTISHGAGGVTQFADTNGRVQVNTLTQDGYPAGELVGVSVNERNRLTGTYSNGRTIDIAEIALADFNGPEMLKRLDGGAFAATEESGPAFFGASGKIINSALEASNTDIADEFTRLIVTQQAYSANTRIVTSANEMVRDLLNMLR